MIDLHDFYNDGFGWVCRQCASEIPEPPTESGSRLLREGEAESKHPQLSNPALARWADVEQRTLMCPQCGITERVERS